MDNSQNIEYRRFYLVESLPEPLTRASRHLQMFDNYIANTRLRLRSLRIPETKEWIYLLQQREWVEAEGVAACCLTEIRLNDAEHAQLEHLEGTEIRKNRYLHEFRGRGFEFDVYLGELWGLNRASVSFESAEAMMQFPKPEFAFIEVTGDPFFRDENLVEVKFADVQAAVAQLTESQTSGKTTNAF